MSDSIINKIVNFVELLIKTKDAATQVRIPIRETQFAIYYKNFENACKTLIEKIMIKSLKLKHDVLPADKEVVEIISEIKKEMPTIKARYSIIRSGSELEGLDPYIIEAEQLHSKTAAQIFQEMRDLDNKYNNLIRLYEQLSEYSSGTGITARLFKAIFK